MGRVIYLVGIVIEGHTYKHDIFELVRVFFPDSDMEIVFLENKDITDANGYIVESILNYNGMKYIGIARLYRGGELIGEHCESIEDIHIGNLDMGQRIKTGIKKSIYNLLVRIFEIDVPWGILTGIRPVKIVHNLIDLDMEEYEILRILITQYRIHRTKAKLILDIAKLQRKYIYPLSKDRYSIYIGIPFCPTRCVYCSFPAYRIGKNYDMVKAYVDTLLYEIDKMGKIMKGKLLNTIYIGGGTPTAINIFDLERIIDGIFKSFPMGEVREFTVEAGRPDTINIEVLSMLREHGVNRISINPQTMNDSTLKLIGRNHDKYSTISAYSLAKDVGFDIINMDIILGLPGEGIDELENTLHAIEEMNPENLTVHTLSLKRGSRLLMEQGNRILNKRVDVQHMIERTQMFAEDNGYLPYYLYRQKQILGNLENVGYSKLNKECIFNIAMMEEKETVIGMGLGAVSKIYYPQENRIKRIPNFKDLVQYNTRIDELIDKKKGSIPK